MKVVVGFIHQQRRTGAVFAIVSNCSRDATPPVGLFGLATAISRVDAVMFASTFPRGKAGLVTLHPDDVAPVVSAKISYMLNVGVATMTSSCGSR